ncbi:MAG: glycosyltransferase family 4 protein [Angustibacter sp.]
MSTINQAVIIRALAPVRRATRMVRDLPLAASVGWRHLTWDRWHAASLLLRALPRPIARLLARTGSPPYRVLALAAVGHRDRAVAVAVAVADSAAGTDGAGGIAGGARARSSSEQGRGGRWVHRLARRRQLEHLVAVACAVDAVPLAERLLRQVRADRPAPAPTREERLAALVAARQGRLVDARDHARRAGRRGTRLARRLEAELAVLTPARAAADRTSSRTDDPRGVGPDRGGVLHLVTNALPEVQAGYTVRTQGIAGAQRALGDDARVATRLGFPVIIGALGPAASVQVDEVPYHRLLPPRPLPVLADRRQRADIKATDTLVGRLRPRVLHAHSNHLNAQVALAVGRRRGLPVVYEVRGFLEETWRSRGGDPAHDVYRLSRDAETWCARQADAVVTLSSAMRADLLSRGVPQQHVHVVPNAVDDTYLAEPDDPEGAAASARAELDLPAAGTVVLGMISTLNDYEGGATLVDALAMLVRDGAPVHLLVVGDGPARQSWLDQARRAGLDRHVTATGRVPRDAARRAHLATDVFCVPRQDTPVTRLVPPLKPLEAMASGRPVLASDLPPLRETVQDGVTGLLVPPQDAAALARALTPLLYDSQTRRRMGQAARAWVLEHRTWHRSAQWYGSLYDEVVERMAERLHRAAAPPVGQPSRSPHHGGVTRPPSPSAEGADR